MLRYVFIMILMTVGNPANSHEMVPTYLTLEPSHINGLQKTSLTVFNKRVDVEYYEIGVFTEEWEPIKFVSNYKIFNPIVN